MSHARKYRKFESRKTNAAFTPPKSLRSVAPVRRLVAVVGPKPEPFARRLVIDSRDNGTGGLHAVVEAFIPILGERFEWRPMAGTQVPLAPEDVERLAYALADELPPSDGAEALAGLQLVASGER